MPPIDEEAQDLRSVLSQVVTDSEAEEASAAVAITPEPKATSEAGETAPKSRERGADGKFLPKDAANAGDGEIEEPAEPAADSKEGEALSPVVIEPPPADVPQHWAQADKDLIAALPKEHQAKVVERYKAIEAGFTPKLQRAAEIERQYQGAMEMFAPHAEGLRQRGQTPSDVIRAWGQIEQDMMDGRVLASAGQQNVKGAQHVARMIQAYGIDPGLVASILRGEQTAPQQNGNGATAAIPPEFVQEMRSLRARQDARDQAEAQQREAGVQSELDAFANEKDETGQLKNPFFSEVESDMAALAQIEISQRRMPKIADLYDRAVHANPTTRAKVLAAQQAEQTRKAAAERKAKAEAAGRAASSITGSPGSGGSPAERRGPRSLREEIAEAAADTA